MIKKLLCKIFGHKYKSKRNIFGFTVKRYCIKCNDIIFETENKLISSFQNFIKEWAKHDIIIH